MESGCSDDSPECVCPCGCGCQNDPKGGDIPFKDYLDGTTEIPYGDVGLCAGCAQGKHEVPPEEVMPVERLIALHEDILSQLKKVKEERHGSHVSQPGSDGQR